MSHYNEDGRHVCWCGAFTHYQAFSGGREFYCEECDANGTYPDDGWRRGPRARLLAAGPDGIALLRAQMDQELARLKDQPS